MSLRIVLVVLVLVVAACGRDTQGTPAPAGLTGTVTYRNGSVAPPYHYEWRVEFGARGARLEWTPGYDGAESWTETADLAGDQLADLAGRLRDTGLYEHTGEDDGGLVGGPTGRATITSADYDSGTLGTTAASGDLLAEVAEVAKSAFPAEVWSEMERKQAEWGSR